VGQGIDSLIAFQTRMQGLAGLTSISQGSPAGWWRGRQPFQALSVAIASAWQRSSGERAVSVGEAALVLGREVRQFRRRWRRRSSS
jgi:hypothetical protein